MTHTLVAAFDNLADAQAAKAQLIIQPVLESNIKLASSEFNFSESGIGATGDHDAHHDSFSHKVSHFFSSLFGNDEDHNPHRHGLAYPEAYRRGAAVLTVILATEEEADRAEEVLERNGAIDIDERSATWGTTTTTGTNLNGGTDAATHIAGTHLGADRTEMVDRASENNVKRTSIPVIEENLRVGKRGVGTGRVRVVSRVTERPVEETVNLHEEHAHIERRPVDRPAAAGELNSFKAGSIEIQETAEELVVEKSARVIEEVTVGRQSSDRQETVHDTVRRTDVDVLSEPNSTVDRDILDTISTTDPLKKR